MKRNEIESLSFAVVSHLFIFSISTIIVIITTERESHLIFFRGRRREEKKNREKIKR